MAAAARTFQQIGSAACNSSQEQPKGLDIGSLRKASPAKPSTVGQRPRLPLRQAFLSQPQHQSLSQPGAPQSLRQQLLPTRASRTSSTRACPVPETKEGLHDAATAGRLHGWSGASTSTSADKDWRRIGQALLDDWPEGSRFDTLSHQWHFERDHDPSPWSVATSAQASASAVIV